MISSDLTKLRRISLVLYALGLLSFAAMLVGQGYKTVFLTDPTGSLSSPSVVSQSHIRNIRLEAMKAAQKEGKREYGFISSALPTPINTQ